MLFSRPSRRLPAMFALATAFLLVASDVADARAGRGGFGFGSRGGRTFQAPPPTNTAPRTASPIERSTTPQPARPGVSQGVQRPAAATTGGFFSRRGGFMGGLLGAGLLGMLLGYGLFGGLGGLASILGLLLQVVLIVWIARLAFRWFQRRQQPAYAGAGAAPYERQATPGPSGYRSPAGGGGAVPPAGRMGAVRDEIGIGEADLNEFERLLGTIQTAYGQEDLATLRRHATPEVASHLELELNENAARGVVNRVSDPRLLQGDLSEAWREGDAEYATVAMRFSLLDHVADRATGRVVEGDPSRPTEATEVWTFTRPRGGRWMLSAIQQS